ncbi:MAG: hypothetical protein LBN09_09180 [Clostridioides sp.]|nr:hypothetical protein [Clostridioides sp.]
MHAYSNIRKNKFIYMIITIAIATMLRFGGSVAKMSQEQYASTAVAESESGGIQGGKAITSVKEDPEDPSKHYDKIYFWTRIVAFILMSFGLDFILGYRSVDKGLNTYGSKKRTITLFVTNLSEVFVIGSILGFVLGYIEAEILLKNFNVGYYGLIDFTKVPIRISYTSFFQTISVTFGLTAILAFAPIVNTIESDSDEIKIN